MNSGLVAGTIAFSSVDGPGNRFVVFCQGCNFDCVACHNPQTIPGHEPVDGEGPRRRSVDDVLVELRRAAPFVRGLTVSGGEATQQHRFVHDLFAAVKTDPELCHLSCLVDTNGAAPSSVWDELAPVMDGAMVDLKCLDDDIHRSMTGHSNTPVLASIRDLQQRSLLHEVRLLIVAGLNDDAALIDRTGRWLALVDPTMRVKVIGFRHHGARPHDPPLEEPTALHLADIAARLRSISPFQITVI